MKRIERIQQRMMHHLRVLASEIGARPIGTEGNRAASAYIEGVFRGAGLEVETQSFEVPAWSSEGAYLTIQGERLSVQSNTFTAPCDVAAEIFPICTMEQLESSYDLTNKIALLYGELTKEPWVPKGFTIYNPEHHRKMIHLLEKKRPAAVITVGTQTENDLPIIRDWDFPIPSVTVTPEVGLLLLTNRESTSVQLTIHSSIQPGSTNNIIGRLAGRREDKIILTAHYDTVFGTSGAFDNASGICVLLTIAEYMAERHHHDPGLEFIAFSSEEYLGLGDQIYVSRYADQFDRVLAAMNFDGIGQTVGTNNLTLMAGSEEFLDEVKAIKANHPSIQWTDPWYESNHYTFFSRGVPSIPFSCSGVQNLLHTREDRVEWISPAKCYEVYKLALELIEMLQDKTPEWTRGRTGGRT